MDAGDLFYHDPAAGGGDFRSGEGDGLDVAFAAEPEEDIYSAVAILDGLKLGVIEDAEGQHILRPVIGQVAVDDRCGVVCGNNAGCVVYKRVPVVFR